MRLPAAALNCYPCRRPHVEDLYCKATDCFGNTEIASDLKEREPQRAALYMATVALLRASANVADEPCRPPYSAGEASGIKQQLDHYLKCVRSSAKPAARRSTSIPKVCDLVEMNVGDGLKTRLHRLAPMSVAALLNAISSQLCKLKGNKDAIAETIENNLT